MNRLRLTRIPEAAGLATVLGLALAACGADAFSGESADKRNAGAPVICGSTVCQVGFVCEFDACVAEDDGGGSGPPPNPGPGEPASPLASSRYIYLLEKGERRLVQIDSLTLNAASLAAGLAPMDMAVIGSRELTVVADALDLLEVVDHRGDPVGRFAWETAPALSHIKASPSGEHVVAYFDWDDPAAQDRQTQNGNINKVSVLYVGEGDAPLGSDDDRLRNVSVGFLPRDVRFSQDGSRLIVISRDIITPVTLLSEIGAVAVPEAPISFDGEASEILIDATASTAILRYPGEPRVDVITLATGAVTCFAANSPITDITLGADGSLLATFGAASAHDVAKVELAAATTLCTPLTSAFAVDAAPRLAAHPTLPLAIAYATDLAVERFWALDTATLTSKSIALEKAVAAVAFTDDARYLVVSHLKAPGTPAWNPTIEDPDLSVDKSYGVSWADLSTATHHLAVSDVPFGPFGLVPPTDATPAATFQTVLDGKAPRALRISHAPGFDEASVELAAEPREIGYLPQTGKTFITQTHPWGRVTFMDRNGGDLRHVTGFALGGTP